MVAEIPAPAYEEGHPLQAHVTNLDASPYVGRLALCRVRNGTIRAGQPIAWCRADGTIERATVTNLYVTDALERVEADEAGPGEIIAVAGIPEVTIGETLADPDDPRPLPVITVDEPSLSMIVGINTSPLAGRDGDKLTARQIKDRLDQELVGNVSIRVLDTERPDAWEVQGRGELQLVVLLEMMRREGYELTAGQPQVVTREVDGKTCEPVERLAIDVPEEYVGVVTQALAVRKGRMEQMVNHSTGWVRLEFLVPARGLIGFRTEFLTETRGTGLMHHVFDRWEPWAGELRTRPTGSLVADRTGKSASFALFGLQERGSLFVGPGEEVYEGMIVGENARSDDLDVNATKEKHQTNVRAASADVLVRLIPHKQLSLEQAIEFLREDECVEITPGVGPPPQGRAGEDRPGPRRAPRAGGLGLLAEPAVADALAASGHVSAVRLQVDDLRGAVVVLVQLEDVVLRVGDVDERVAALPVHVVELDVLLVVARRVNVRPADAGPERDPPGAAVLAAARIDHVRRRVRQSRMGANEVAKAVDLLLAGRYPALAATLAVEAPELEARGVDPLPVAALAGDPLEAQAGLGPELGLCRRPSWESAARRPCSGAGSAAHAARPGRDRRCRSSWSPGGPRGRARGRPRGRLGAPSSGRGSGGRAACGSTASHRGSSSRSVAAPGRRSRTPRARAPRPRSTRQRL